MIFEKIKNFIKNLKPEWLIFGLSLVWGSFFAWYINKIVLLVRLEDQAAHLNLARQVTDSMTPGISQIGFWPPLLHLFLIPFTAINFLYKTGLAGAFTLVPFLGLAAIFLYKLLFVFTKNKFISFFGAILFLLNPYILYYSVTPMMEVLFIALLFGTAYFLIQWLNTDNIKYLILLSIFVSLSSMARFEGLILIPLVGLIVLMHLIKQKILYKKIEAMIILFSFIAILGFLFILVYGWIFGDNPFAFMGGDWSAVKQQEDFLLPAKYNFFTSLQYLLYASYYIIGKWQIFIALLSFIILLIIYRKFKFIAVVLILISPFVFDCLALYRGNIVIYLPELPPVNAFFNERYGIFGVGFVVFNSLVLAGILNKKYLYLIKKIKLVNLFIGFIGLVFLLVLLFLNISFLYKTSYLEKFIIIKTTFSGFPPDNQIDLGKQLEIKYDYGKIATTRTFTDFVAINAGIPLKNYIIESNYKFYDQTIKRPWLFARWVIMDNVESKTLSNWEKTNEKISVKWGKSQTFLKYFNLVLGNNDKLLYKINEEAVKQYAIDKKLNLSEIPSLNSNITWWNPETIYEKMGAKNLEKITEINIKIIAIPTPESMPSPKPILEITPVPAPVLAPEPVLTKYIVKEGDNLWNISKKLYGSGVGWKILYEQNQLENPNLIRPNDILIIKNL